MAYIYANALNSEKFEKNSALEIMQRYTKDVSDKYLSCDGGADGLAPSCLVVFPLVYVPDAVNKLLCKAKSLVYADVQAFMESYKKDGLYTHIRGSSRACLGYPASSCKFDKEEEYSDYTATPFLVFNFILKKTRHELMNEVFYFYVQPSQTTIRDAKKSWYSDEIVPAGTRTVKPCLRCFRFTYGYKKSVSIIRDINRTPVDMFHTCHKDFPSIFGKKFLFTDSQRELRKGSETRLFKLFNVSVLDTIKTRESLRQDVLADFSIQEIRIFLADYLQMLRNEDRFTHPDNFASNVHTSYDFYGEKYTDEQRTRIIDLFLDEYVEKLLKNKNRYNCMRYVLSRFKNQSIKLERYDSSKMSVYNLGEHVVPTRLKEKEMYEILNQLTNKEDLKDIIKEYFLETIDKKEYFYLSSYTSACTMKTMFIKQDVTKDISKDVSEELATQYLIRTL